MMTELKSVAEYKDFVAENPVAVVHVGFHWNSFDRTMQRTLIELAPEFDGKVRFAFLDVDRNETVEIIKQINLVNVPTLVYFQNGNHIATEVGMRPMDDVRGQIISILETE
jgi:thioredoxin-like negative regulator of GroEL